MEEEKRLFIPLDAQPSWQKGFTFRAFIAIFLAVVVFQPCVIWLSWSAGVVLEQGAVFSALVLAVAVSRWQAKPLSRQEGFMIYDMISWALFEIPFAVFLYNQYVATSPAAIMWDLIGKIPNWYAPYQVTRTFLDSRWIFAIVVALVSWGLSVLARISIGYILYHIFAVEEKLDYPFQKVWITECSIIVHRERFSDSYRTFILSAFVGLGFTVFTYGWLITTGQNLLPVPWADLNRWIEAILPGASFGIASDLITFSIGFVMPWNVVLSTLLGGISVWVVGNTLIVQYTEIFPRWAPRMSLGLLWQQSQMYVWMNFLIGLGIAIGLTNICFHFKQIGRALSSLHSISRVGKGAKGAEEELGLPLWTLLALYFAGTFGLVFLSWMLAPDFPIWVWLLFAGWNTLLIFVNARAIGDTGYQIGIPYVKEGLCVAAGYKGVAGWFAPSGVSGLPWSPAFVACRLSGTSIRDYIKAYFATTVLAWLISFVYVSIFWQFSPIPSANYSYIMFQWPLSSFWQLMWVKMSAAEIVKPLWIIASLVGGSAIAAVSHHFGLFFNIVGFSLGATQVFPLTFTMFLGGFVGKIMERMKREWWKTNKVAIAAGLGFGEGLLVSVCIGIRLMSGSAWILPA